MQLVTCQRCGKVATTANAYVASGQNLCADCARAEVDFHEGNVPLNALKPMAGSTPCAHCQGPIGEAGPRFLGEVAICATCDHGFRNRPFPRWLKGLALGLLGIVAFSFIHNWRFFQAHIELRRAGRAVEARDLDLAARWMVSASRRVPESPQLAAATHQLESVVELKRLALMIEEDHPTAARDALKALQPQLPPDLQQTGRSLMLRAEMSIAFDEKDYDRFLAQSREFAKAVPNGPVGSSTVASALACKYAVTGNEQFKKDALAALKEASEAPAEGEVKAAFAKYQNRMQHRLATRKIIKQKEFEREFPNGWTEDATR